MNFKEIKTVLKKAGLNLNNKIIKGLELLLNKVDSSDTPKKGISLAIRFDSGFDLPESVFDKDGLAREMNFQFNFTRLGEYFSVLNCDLEATSEFNCDVQFLYQVGNTSFSAVIGISIEIDAEDGTYNVVIGEVDFSPYNTIYTEETDKEAIAHMIRGALEAMDPSIILKSNVGS